MCYLFSLFHTRCLCTGTLLWCVKHANCNDEILTLEQLAKASSFALVSMIIIILTVVTQGPIQPPNLRGALRGSLLINDGVFQAIGVISFAFVCHHNSLLIYGSLKTPTMDRFAKVTHYSTSISMVACMAMALGGYLSFGDLTKGNVLNNFPTNNVVVNIARL